MGDSMKVVPALTLLKHKRTKIIATIGPASSSEAVIQDLIHQGVDVFRLNMSHGTHQEHKTHYQRIRKLAAACDKHIAILADLCGPKIRTGTFKGGSITLEKGATVTVTMRDVQGEHGLICSQYKKLAQDVQPEQRIFLADGVMELKVLSIDGTDVLCEVVQGGKLGNHKGINLPDATVSAPSMTDKDYQDAEFATDLGVDFLALSFVRYATDVHELRAWLDKKGVHTSIISKIERPEALEDAEAIIQASDVIMVARGDLGVELPPEQVPVAQKMLIDEARKQHKPVIVATQILESMIENARPTRAEVTDIFHAVTSSADAVMLSGETAVGAFPVETVAMMVRVIHNAEAYLWKNGAFSLSTHAQETQDNILSFGDAIARSTALLSRDLMVRGVVVLSKSGITAATVSSARPEAPILGVSITASACRKMNILWGVIPVLTNENEIQNHIKLAKDTAKRYKLATTGDSILLVQGFHYKTSLNHPSVMALEV